MTTLVHHRFNMIPYDPSVAPAETVIVLMSTYNGEKYVADQIRSIICQLGPEDQLLIRDDGSTDETVNIIFSFNDARIEVVVGSNIGFARSFFWLLYHADRRHAIYMLADQDDVWLPEKIARARTSLAQDPSPRLYCTRLQLVDTTLRPLGLSPALRVPPGFENAVCENIATGCTIALNSAAMDVVQKVQLSALENHKIHYHDWWLYLLISYFGCVIWDSNTTIMYRQHALNSVGMAAGLSRYWLIWKSVRSKSWIKIMLFQLRAFIKEYGDQLSTNDRSWITSLCTGTPTQIAWALTKDSRLQRQQPFGKLLFRGLTVYDLFRGNIQSFPPNI
ncbi:MAG: glycosyltransferase family 2 protein [Caldilineaceae bacterium]|nr:glycosyltransferase family 2 protein [Nitrospira sp.]MCB0145599.1 glycosyltransferase family 2 protein [Caldilineaceae bacterium]MCB9155493.1 glycosyltransferase family 2 protein [Caldilineaceae bacterium]